MVWTLQTVIFIAISTLAGALIGRFVIRPFINKKNSHNANKNIKKKYSGKRNRL